MTIVETITTEKSDKVDAVRAYTRNAVGQCRISIRHQIYEDCKGVALSMAGDAAEYEELIKVIIEELKI